MHAITLALLSLDRTHMTRSHGKRRSYEVAPGTKWLLEKAAAHRGQSQAILVRAALVLDDAARTWFSQREAFPFRDRSSDTSGYGIKLDEMRRGVIRSIAETRREAGLQFDGRESVFEELVAFYLARCSSTEQLFGLEEDAIKKATGYTPSQARTLWNWLGDGAAANALPPDLDHFASRAASKKEP